MAECPESIEELEALEQPEEVVYIPIKKSRLHYYICPKVNEEKEIMTYFITDGRYIKIGKAVNIVMRLKELQSGNPNQLIPIIIIYADAERLFHRCFKKHRIRNEWFCLPDNYIEIVINLCAEQNLKYQVEI